MSGKFCKTAAKSPPAGTQQQTACRTKAETLQLLAGRLKHAAVPRLIHFTVSEWRSRTDCVLSAIDSNLKARRLAVRSSARHEDAPQASLAGHYYSALDVANHPEALSEAIDRVVASMSEHPFNQVLIQEMVAGDLNGVIITHDLNTGAPYYHIEYHESSRTDGVTRGAGGQKTVVVHHQAPSAAVPSKRVLRLLEMTRELGRVWSDEPLDIEFAQTPDRVFLLQVRPVTVRHQWNRSQTRRLSRTLRDLEQVISDLSRPRPHLSGSRTIFGQMPDWNPAELIGPHPRPLSVSLFEELITNRVWRDARAAMGYRTVPETPLMVTLAGRPFIDVRASFNSFLPPGLPRPVERAIVDAWLERLGGRPESHDKIEFEVAVTALDLCFSENWAHRYSGVLSPVQLSDYADRLRALTNQNVSLGRDAALTVELRAVSRLRNRRTNGGPVRHADSLDCAFQLLEECRRRGTHPFAIVARQAFIAEALLRSALQRGALTADRLNAFRQSLNTVCSRVQRDLVRVSRGELDQKRFLTLYGHLRPGSFDIQSQRYDQRCDLFEGVVSEPPAALQRRADFVLTSRERQALNQLLSESKLATEPEELIRYARVAIEGREYAKFLFSRHLSDALEKIADWGRSAGLSRSELSFLTLGDLSSARDLSSPHDLKTRFAELAEVRRLQTAELSGLRLGYLVRRSDDLYVPLQNHVANFITDHNVAGATVCLDGQHQNGVDLADKIVLVEAADPGFDWIFAKGFRGLITMFGGANSHMAIRCAELMVPAAIGVGEASFERCKRSASVELNCRDRTVRHVG